jgi:hypothetical protein
MIETLHVDTAKSVLGLPGEGLLFQHPAKEFASDIDS